jgi:membrane-associated phospholipid phosphatase
MSLKAENPRASHWPLIAVGLLLIVVAFIVDKLVDNFLFLPTHQTPWQIAWWVSWLGDWPLILLVGLVGVAAFAWCRELATSRLLLLILLAGLLTGLASTVIRSTVGRTRPTAAAPQGFYGLWYQGKWIGGKYEFSSFPSGHTATWAGLAGAAWLRRRRLGIALLAVAGVVAWSRMALGCHHFSDVTVSIIFGLIVGGWLCQWIDAMVRGNSDRNYDAATSA